jgi:hypothetical protein
VQDTTAVGPRVSVNYALTADRQNIVRMTSGIVHDAASTNSQTTLGQNTSGYTDLYDLDLDGAFETQLHTAGITQQTLTNVIDLPGFRQPHTLDITAGYARQLPGRITLDVSMLRREFKDRTAMVDTNGIYNGVVFQGYANPDFTEIYRITANTSNWLTYTAFNVQAARDGGRWQFLADYTRQFRHLDGTWQPNDPASFIQPNAFPDDKGIGTPVTQVANSLSGTALTSAPQWQDHVLRTAVSTQLPWKLLLAGGFNVQSGPWSGPIVTRIAAADPQFGPSLVTLSNGKRVSNPLATTIRFAYPTRGEGQIRLPALKNLNMRLGRQFAVSHVRIDATAEVLNVLNGGGSSFFASGANQQYNVNFGTTSATLQPPRSVQAILRVAF